MELQLKEYNNKGMFQDTSISKSSNEFAFENRNIRITAMDDRTLLSVTNEKGPKDTQIQIRGYFLGKCICNDSVIIFTKDTDFDYIIKVFVDDKYNELTYKDLYRGNLNFNINNPIEAIFYYESKDIQKVYWVDGINPTRMFNIENKESITSNTKEICTKFDFNPTINKVPLIEVIKDYSGSGLFPAGVIQYFVSLYNKFEASTPILATTSLNYITFTDRGAKADEQCKLSFNIKITNLDKDNFNSVRVYSLIRTSIDGPKELKIVGDYDIPDNGELELVDTNINKEVLSDTDIYYIGGQAFIASTLDQKDNTAFFGDITIGQNINYDKLRIIAEKQIKHSDSNNQKISTAISFKYKTVEQKNEDTLYNWDNQLNNSGIKVQTFKGGEWYRFSVQFMTKTGEWTTPLYIGDAQNTLYPKYDNNGNIQIASIRYIPYQNLNADEINYLTENFIGYRLLMAETNYNNRGIVAQGILCPTVFNYQDRAVGRTFAESSWIMRPRNIGNVASVHYSPITNEIQNLDYGSMDAIVDKHNVPYVDIDNSITTKGYLYTLTCSKTKVVRLLGPWVNESDYKLVLRVYNATLENKNLTVQSLEHELIADGGAKLTGSWKEARTKLLELATKAGIDVDMENILPDGSFICLLTGGETLDGNHSRGRFSAMHTECKSSTFSTDDILTQLKSIRNPEIDLDSVQFEDDVTLDNTYDTNKGTHNGFGISTFIEGQQITQMYPEQKRSYFVDEQVVTLHTPEISKVDDIVNAGEYDLNIVGIVPISGIYSDSLIETENTGYSYTARTLSSPNIKTGDTTAPLLSDYLWNDLLIAASDQNKYVNYKVYMWNRNGSLSGHTNTLEEEETSIPAILKHKIFGNFYTSNDTIYFSSLKKYTTAQQNNVLYEAVNPIVYQDDSVLRYIKWESQNKLYAGEYDNVLSMYGNSDKDYYVQKYYNISDNKEEEIANVRLYDPIRIKYKSTPHITISLGDKKILPRFNASPPWNINYIYNTSDTSTESELETKRRYSWFTTEETDARLFKSPEITIQNGKDSSGNPLYLNPDYPYLFIGELAKKVTNVDELYGDLEHIKWIPLSLISPIDKAIETTAGDTYFQRWDCLKTYPSTEEDTNSIVDITSFMVESRINLDARTDVNRGTQSLLRARPNNYNLFNTVYDQLDDTFEYNILDEKYDLNTFSNQVAYTLPKIPSDNIDTWSELTLNNILSLDGSYGSINKIINLNDTLLVFQDNAISSIAYNDKTILSTELGVPVQIANSNKVEGYQYISNNIGCRNKWSICNTSSGLMFIDDNTRILYRINKEGINDLSTSGGMSQWFKDNLNGEIWNPINKGFRINYDYITKDAYIENEDNCLLYNDLLGTFTSFMDCYKDTPLLFNLKNKSYISRVRDSKGDNSGIVRLYEMFGGEYNKNFDGVLTDYSVLYKVNPEPYEDKIFTNIDFIADLLHSQTSNNRLNVDVEYPNNIVSRDGDFGSIDNKILLDETPFNNLKVWNEHQYGESDLKFLSPLANLKKKFRIWRIDIPRDNTSKYKLNRIRNPWVYIKLSKTFGNSLNMKEEAKTAKMVFHNIAIKYYK